MNTPATTVKTPTPSLDEQQARLFPVEHISDEWVRIHRIDQIRSAS